MAVLNAFLFGALQACFGKVLVANEGEHSHVYYCPDWTRGGKPRAETAHSGEYYRVNCPFCTDSRFRLWINHRWGVYDQVTGNYNLHLAHCYNTDGMPDGCLAEPGRRQQLERMLLINNNGVRCVGLG